MEENKPKEQSNAEQKPSQAAFIRLCVSLLILGTALILRTFFPEPTQNFLKKAVAGGFDYTAILGDVGQSLRAFMVGVPHPDEKAKVDGDVETEEEGLYANSDLLETFDPENEPPPDDSVGSGGFDVPVLWVDARLFPSQLDDEDDTLPLPFGLQKPDRVDYTVYELPFETVMPVEGRLTSSFGYRIHPVYGDWRFHYGIDIANTSGTKIKAFADGTVWATGTNAGYGKYLIIEHEDGYVSLYAHCSKITAKAGDKVKAGDSIAAVGSTGVSTGPHLHFELRRENAFLDPSPYLAV